MPFNQLYEEQELLVRITHGNERAFHDLYQHYFPKVYAMCVSYAPDVAVAQDVVQETFTRVWLNRHKLTEVEHFEAWLITITRNLLITELRKAFPPGWQPEEVKSIDSHDVVNYRELEKLLDGAVAALSKRQQEVYRLSRVEGYSHKEIARSLGISVDMSREHLSKALHHIRHFLRQQYGQSGMLLSLLFFC
ncbi:RNA polymerase sigma-70 factor (ECF subfamily) [Filimonas zeae]|uniref:RNA polymerase sigma24 factor n=1 Tax=Filimonas zeae TaxID=1737353 RepID=A0A917J099_9BACT|nr:sigma-70 family RNA polymerase sigma factor [Filimonas zeae]MDR6339867.1 RNA polymerase sigma-70 factor (ECF subfamily) [Filimonas zeae]GGH70042.1 RNA polymerase sigma24 factor [Filimonas zeae]